MFDYYAILRVDQAATKWQIKSAFKRRIKEWHPDTNPDPRATRHCQLINEAFECLMNPIARAIYDIQLREARERAQQRANAQQKTAPPKDEPPKREEPRQEEPKKEEPKPRRRPTRCAEMLDRPSWLLVAAGLIGIVVGATIAPSPKPDAKAAAPATQVTDLQRHIEALWSAGSASAEHYAEAKRLHAVRVAELEAELRAQQAAHAAQEKHDREELDAVRAVLLRANTPQKRIDRFNGTYRAVFGVPYSADPCHGPLLQGLVCTVARRLDGSEIAFVASDVKTALEARGRPRLDIAFRGIHWTLVVMRGNNYPFPEYGTQINALHPALRAPLRRTLNAFGFENWMIQQCETQSNAFFINNLAEHECVNLPPMGQAPYLFQFRVFPRPESVGATAN